MKKKTKADLLVYIQELELENSVLQKNNILLKRNNAIYRETIDSYSHPTFKWDRGTLARETYKNIRTNSYKPQTHIEAAIFKTKPLISIVLYDHEDEF